MGNISPSFSLERSSDCQIFYWEDDTCTYNASTCPSGYSSPNYTKEDITLTVITVSDTHGNEWTYEGYLPTDGEVELTYANFTQTVEAATTTTDTGCGCTTEETEATSFADKCYSWQYDLYVGETLVGTTSTLSFFYCEIRNDIFDLIEGTCSDCCDAEKQAKIHEIKTDYDIMLITYNKVGCSCAEGLLTQLQKKVAKLQGNC